MSVMISQNVSMHHTNKIQKHNGGKPLNKKHHQERSTHSNDNKAEEKTGSDDNRDIVPAMGKMTRKRKNRRAREEKLEMEKDNIEKKRLESLLFGFDKNQFEVNVAEIPTWFTDKTPGFERSALEEEDGCLEDERKPVWIDEEETQALVDVSKVNLLKKLRKEEKEGLISGTDYVNRLRQQHARLNPGTEWADPARLKNRDVGFGSDDSDEDGSLGFRASEGFEDGNDLLRSNEEFVVRSKEKLLPGLIEYSRLTDANAEDPSNAVVQSVAFHRNGQLLLAAGLDKKLKLFQIDGKRNAKIQSMFIQDLPIYKAAFLPDGSQVIMAGRRKHFYSLDVVSGKLDRVCSLIGREEKSLESFEVSSDSSLIAFLGNAGYIMLVSTKTKQLIGTLKMNGSVRAAAFAEGGNQLLSAGGDGHIYHWDLRTRKCIHKGNDEGCVNSSALSVSPDSKLFAAGSDSGIVNIYNRDEFLGGVKRPAKSLTNLVTVVDNLKFNVDSQILAICSRLKRNNLKLVHLPSCTVFSNFPSPKTPLQYVHSLDFSPGGGLLAVGNAAGKVLLYKLHHYQHA